MSKSETAPGVGGRGTHSVMTAPTPPKMSEFDLTNVRIERAENGVTIDCGYKMKPETEKAMRSAKGKEGYIDYDVRNPSEKHVFNDPGEAAKFIEARLLGKEPAKAGKVETASKAKVTVTKR